MASALILWDIAAAEGDTMERQSVPAVSVPVASLSSTSVPRRTRIFHLGFHHHSDNDCLCDIFGNRSTTCQFLSLQHDPQLPPESPSHPLVLHYTRFKLHCVLHCMLCTLVRRQPLDPQHDIIFCYNTYPFGHYHSVLIVLRARLIH